MRLPLALPLLSLAAIALDASPVAAQGFKLPPSPTPSSTPAYGPQDPERPRSRPIPEPTATPTPAASPTAAPSSAPSTSVPPASGPVIQPIPQPRSSATQLPPQPLPRTGQSLDNPALREDEPAPPLDLPDVPAATATTPASQSATDTSPPVPATEESGIPWLWLALGALLAALAAGFAWWRRRERDPATVSVPRIERPKPVEKPARQVTVPARAEPVPGLGAAAPVAGPTPAPEDPVSPAPAVFGTRTLEASFEARSITTSMVYATLAYRIVVTNCGDEVLTNIMAGGTMEAAQDGAPLDAQLRPPSGQLPVLHQLERLEPGATEAFSGEFRVPLESLHPIRRGEARLLVPIARVRAAATPEGGTPIVTQQSVLLGLPDKGAMVGPIRLDLGPRVFAELQQRTLAKEPA